MNNSPQSNPYVRWRTAYPYGSLDRDMENQIVQWGRVSSELIDLLNVYEQTIEPWLKNKKAPEPDLVAFVAGYGYTRVAVGDWKEVPVSIPEDELEDWDDNSGLLVSLEQIHEYQAGIAGCVAEMLGADSKRVVATLLRQLDSLLDEMSSLTQGSLESFTPTQWENDDLGEEYVDAEVSQLDRIFDLYEELWCFEQGIEELRMLMITEDDEEFDLPNQAFYDALLSIDSHKLIVNLERTEPRLREVLKLWSNTIMRYSGEPYHRPYDQNAPEVFWWRHRQSSRNPRQNGNRPPRRNNRRSTK